MAGHHHAHHHTGDEPAGPVAPGIERILGAVAGLCALVTVIGLIVLWPASGDRASTDPMLVSADPVAATVQS